MVGCYDLGKKMVWIENLSSSEVLLKRWDWVKGHLRLLDDGGLYWILIRAEGGGCGGGGGGGGGGAMW